MHPSLNAKFTSPKELEPRERMPVNQLCWCGSGKKWKKCHRDRELQEPIPLGKLLDDQRKKMLKGYCLHPQARATTCSSKIIHAHTVQRKGGLAAISEDGHIISPKLGFENIFKNKGEIVPRLHGVSDASTFMGFCSLHDDQLFSPIEKAPITLTKEAAFLLSFRAICYEFLAKDAALSTVDVQRELDRGRPFEIQCAIQQQLHFLREGMKRAMKDLQSWKKKYDDAFLSGNYGAFSFYGVMFSNALPLVACGAFHPEFDFNGNHLQMITHGDSEFEHVCFNLTVVNGKSIGILGWTGTSDGPADCFVQSFRALPKSAKANAAFHLACEHLENTYFRPSWWNSQDDLVREYLVGRFRSGIGFSGIDRAHDCLSFFKYTFSTADVEQEITSD